MGILQSQNWVFLPSNQNHNFWSLYLFQEVKKEIFNQEILNQ